MWENKYYQGYYLLTIYYEGKKLVYKLQQFHSDRKQVCYHFFYKGGVQELCFNKEQKKLQHIILPGQVPFPQDFLNKLEEEVKGINSQR